MINRRRLLTRSVRRAAVLGVAAALAGAWGTSSAQGRPDAHRVLGIPLATAGLAAGDGLRTTVTNIGTTAVTVQAVVVDQDGAEVERATLTIPPGASRSLETSRSEIASSDLSAMTYTSILTRPADRWSLLLTTEVVDWATGQTRFVAGTGGCPSFACGSDGNHNETLMPDTGGRGQR